MKHNFMTKMVSALLAVVLSTAAFSVTAFASGGEESTESVAEQETAGDVSDLLSALAGSQVTVSVTEDGIQFSSDENDSGQTGTVTTGGGNLNVRTGAGMDYTAFTQLPNGTTVKVIGTDGDWLKVILPEKVGYVYSGYMTVSDGEAGSGEGSFSLDAETLENLLGILGGGLNGGAALTPDGNLSLIDDIGSPTASGKQFITVETKNGNGTFVSEISLGVFENRKENGSTNEKFLPSELPLSAKIAAAASEFKVQKPMPFAVIAPDQESLPGKNWTTVVARTSKSPWLHNGYCDPGGFMPYKKAVCDYLRQYRGLRCEPEQVITTDGTQQALDLCASVLFERSDKIAVEDPYFQTHINLMEFRGLKPIPIPVTQDGIDIEKLKKQKKIKGVLVTPCHQYPLGYVSSAENNEKLLAWAKTEGAWIIEDDYDSELRYGKKPLPALSSYKEGAPCIYLGSFTKVIYPGFNMAYMVVPKNLITVFEGAKLLIDRHSSEVHQYILAEFIQNGFYYSHVRRLKKIYEKRRQAAVRAIGKYLSAYGHIEGANEGTHLTFIFNHPQDDVKLSELFKRSYQIETRPLSACYRSAKPLTGFILGYAHFTEEELEHAVLKLKDALEQTLG